MGIKPIGGYFEMESLGNGGNFPQSKGLLLNTGRNALEYILKSIGHVEKVYIPYYTCEVVLEPFKKLQIPFVFYHINQYLEIAEKLNLGDSEYVLYTNYFGIKDAYIQQLSCKYGDKLIVDCAQALYAQHITGIKTFYSPRKFVGIPDGAVAYIYNGVNPLSYGVDVSDDRMSHLYLRKEKGPQAGYADFRKNAAKLKMQPILNMSLQTRDMLQQIDFKSIKEQRIRNFRQLHGVLGSANLLAIPNDMSFECPMVYPYWTTDKDLKGRLIKEQVFVATYWPNVLEWTESYMIENDLAKNCLALPIDQRYGEDDINRIIELICK